MVLSVMIAHTLNGRCIIKHSPRAGHGNVVPLRTQQSALQLKAAEAPSPNLLCAWPRVLASCFERGQCFGRQVVVMGLRDGLLVFFHVKVIIFINALGTDRSLAHFDHQHLKSKVKIDGFVEQNVLSHLDFSD